MRKLIVIAIISAVLGIPSLALGGAGNSQTILDGKGSLVLQGAQYIYENQKRARVRENIDELGALATQMKISSEFPKLTKQIMDDEAYLQRASMLYARNVIDQRSQYAAIVDKAISLQAFQEAENRFNAIVGLLGEVKNAQDSQSIAELQAKIKGTLAIIENEATKLHMITHLRGAEKALLDRLKRKRNMQIFYSENEEMPQIKYDNTNRR
ncbi:type IV secretion system protein [Bartonella sp. CB60]|uniref:type IV secretion system protein n=1 Tax=Bartonella sp. CB60 TaxID=3113619 RepID=UPI00300E5698